ncbi:nuclear factor 7, brain-like [Clupea harengus]|uniref:Nuclear factor 7, brain-like n=1 Tax=Clupea harengus TaxID=7950 RepID=A0A8M1KRF3_CLUHA|nr:nuclear factor 7, brain-like [Clupea harengus]
MASKSFSEEDFSCPVCYNIYKDPVLLTCTHSICNTCLQQFWETKGSRECPICRTSCSKEKYPLNLKLKNLCETFQQERIQGEAFCSLHRSELKLFCEDDKQLVCLVCRDSKLHKNHNFSPISEAALERKEELKIKLEPLQKKLDNFKQVKTTSDKTAQHIRVQAQHTERQIKEEFEKLHHPCLSRFCKRSNDAAAGVPSQSESQHLSSRCGGGADILIIDF